MTALWQLEQVSFRHRGATREALRQVTLELQTGRVTAIVGPNGAGKSTLVQLLLGLARPSAGHVRLQGREASTWSREAFAREVGVLPQGEEMVLPLAVKDVVAMGRYPHLGAWRAFGARDDRAVRDALEATCTMELIDRPFADLSGGERQRVRVARALAQDAPTLLLDEPTAALDVRHEMQLFELVRFLGDQGRTLVVVTHALDLAARYADELVLLADGRITAHGTATEVLTASHLSAAFEWPIAVTTRPGTHTAPVPMILPLTKAEADARPAGPA